jgi:hypothetical protein
LAKQPKNHQNFREKIVGCMSKALRKKMLKYVLQNVVNRCSLYDGKTVKKFILSILKLQSKTIALIY